MSNRKYAPPKQPVSTPGTYELAIVEDLYGPLTLARKLVADYDKGAKGHSAVLLPCAFRTQKAITAFRLYLRQLGFAITHWVQRPYQQFEIVSCVVVRA